MTDAVHSADAGVPGELQTLKALTTLRLDLHHDLVGAAWDEEGLVRLPLAAPHLQYLALRENGDFQHENRACWDPHFDRLSGVLHSTSFTL